MQFCDFLNIPLQKPDFTHLFRNITEAYKCNCKKKYEFHRFSKWDRLKKDWSEISLF